MLTRPLGNTGLTVSCLGLGAGHIGSDAMDERDAGRLLNRALDLGISLVDTARGYGLSEARIGRHLAHRRDRFVLVSKCGYGVPGVPDWTPEAITRGVDLALATLATDRIDVMMLHSCPRHVLAQDELIDALDRAVRAGKVLHAGYSGENEDLDAALDSGAFTVLEASVNVFDQRVLDAALPRAAARGAGFIGKRPLGNAPWRFGERPEGHYALAYWDRMRAMRLDPGALAWDELALRFAAYQPGVSTVIAGTGDPEHLAHDVALVEKGPLDPAIVAELCARFRAHDSGWIGQV
jgi:aryl-alcohol dehydrogenase-like predicted oxidoreductase